MPISDRTFVMRAGEQLATPLLDEGLVILALETEQFHTLNGVGALLWRLLDRPRTEHELVELVTTHYDIAWDECADDVLGFLDMLCEANLVTRIKQVVAVDQSLPAAS